MWASVASGSESGPMLQIVDMRVPAVVEDGSATSVILDCDYVLRSADKKSELVVQWYFQNGTSPVYQWIPGKRPQDLGVLKGRLNLDYRASNDPYKRHRALEILKPTYELSGVYRCKVATVEEEAVAARTMIVYSKFVFSIYNWAGRRQNNRRRIMFTFAEGSLDHPSSIDDEGKTAMPARALCGGVAGTGRAQLLAFLLTSEMGRVSIRMTTVEGG